MNSLKKVILIILTVLFVFAGNTLYAQESGDISASATVLDAITVNGVTPLTFGDLERGGSVSIQPTDTENRGQFAIQGSNRLVLLNFTLPEELIYSDGTNSFALPIAFSNSDAIWNNGNGDTSFDPAIADISAVIDGGDVDVFIGGTVNAFPAQEAGEYTGTITLIAEYDL